MDILALHYFKEEMNDALMRISCLERKIEKINKELPFQLRNKQSKVEKEFITESIKNNEVKGDYYEFNVISGLFNQKLNAIEEISKEKTRYQINKDKYAKVLKRQF